jgi:heme/copper-type cytochrome/quinol oxidase subunit 1
MEYNMNMKKYMSLAIVIILLGTTLMYGDYETDKIFNRLEKANEEYYNSQRKALDDYYNTQTLVIIIKLLLGIGVVVFAGVYISRAVKKQKKEERNAVRDIIRTELDSKISSTPKLKTCENCGGAIGKLERSYLFEGQTVCGDCHQRLKSQE